jgi:hypothetical protein
MNWKGNHLNNKMDGEDGHRQFHACQWGNHCKDWQDVEFDIKVIMETMTMIFAKVEDVARQRLGNLQGDQSKV